MKILFSPCHYVYDSSSAGSEISWAYNIADNISTKYPDSIVVTGFSQEQKNRKYQLVELQRGRKELNMGGFNAIAFNIKYNVYSLMFLLNQQFDVLHHVLPFSLYNTFNIACLFVRSIPFVVGPVQSSLIIDPSLAGYETMHSGFNKTVGGKLQKLFFNFIYSTFSSISRFLSVLTLKRANKVVVINNYTKRLILAQGVQENKIVVIPPGIDTKKFKKSISRRKKNHCFKLLVVCYLVKRKGVDMILKAFNEVIHRNQHVHLYIVGDGPEKKILVEMTHALKIGSYISFEGFVQNDKINEYYSNADVFLNMSSSEGFATVCLEAMSAGLAVVSSKVGGFSDAIIDGYNGFLVERGDYLDMSNKICQLIASEKLIDRISRRASDTARTTYDWDNAIIPKYLEVYQEIANSWLSKSEG